MPSTRYAPALMVALTTLAATASQAQTYSWPDNIPPDAKALLQPLPLTPTGQAVPGYPNGVPATASTSLSLTPDQTAKLKNGHFTAGIVMHTMAAGWPLLQVQGITETLKSYGIPVVAVTDAKFQPGTQIANLEEMVARKPSVIFSIPIDPNSEAAAYKQAAAAGIKLVFMDNVPVGMTPGRDYVSVTSSDNRKNADYAATTLAQSMGGKGEVGVITLVYDYYWSVAVRKTGALEAFKRFPGIKVDAVGTFTTPERAYSVATAMLTAHPNMKGIFAAWDTPAEQVAAAAKTLGRTVTVTTNDLAPDSALYVARGDFLAVGAQRPYDQGVAEATSAALSLAGANAPPYVEVPTLRVQKIDLLSALQEVTHAKPPANVIDACAGKCF